MTWRQNRTKLEAYELVDAADGRIVGEAGADNNDRWVALDLRHNPAQHLGWYVGCKEAKAAVERALKREESR